MSQMFLTSINLMKNELQSAVIQVLAADPVGPVEGQVYYNSVVKAIKLFDGAAWQTLDVSLVDNGGGTFTFTDESGATVVFDASTATNVGVSDTDTLDLTLSGDGSVGTPYALSGAVVVDPALSNILTTSVAGVKASVVTNSSLTGLGTTASPLGVAAIALTSVTVVADITARDALTVEEGDVAIVTDAGSGFPETYIRSGVGTWVTVQGSEVASVAGRTGAVTISLDDNTDVDLTTVPPVAGDGLKFDGTNFVPNTAASNSFKQTGVSLLAGVAKTITHSLGVKLVTCQVSLNATGAVVYLDIVLVNTTTLTLTSNSAATVDVVVLG